MREKPERQSDPRRDSLWAWAGVAFSVAFAVLAQFVGAGISYALGYTDPNVPPPLGPALLITLPTLAVAITPAVAAIVFGIRAGRGGRLVGYLAAVLGGLTITFWLFITVSALVNRT